MSSPYQVTRTPRALAGVLVLTLLGCGTLAPDAANSAAISSRRMHTARLGDVISRLPKTPIPCGHVQAAVVDEAAGRVVGDVGLQLTTQSGAKHAVSASHRFVPLVPRDTGVASLRVTRENHVALEFEHWKTFGADNGYQLIVVLSPAGGRVYSMDLGCSSDPE